jgi:hypothetical protein
MNWSDLVPYAKFLHVAAMFAAVTLFVGGDVYFLRVASAGDPGATARLGQAIRRRGPLTGPILEIGVAFGIVTALLGGLDFLAPWLVGAYVIVIALTVLAFRVAAPAFTTILHAAETGDGTAVATALTATSYRLVALVNAALYAAVIFLMVVKPVA